MRDQIFLAHRDEGIQRTVALCVQPNVDVPSILVGAVMDGRPAALAGKISKENVTRAGELSPNCLYCVEQRANHFGGRIGPALVTQMITGKLIWKHDTIFEVSLVGTSVRGGKRLACLDKK